MQVLKLGGSAITKKSGYMHADTAGIMRLARAIAQVWHRGCKDIVLVNGAGSFGHAPAIKFGIEKEVRGEKGKLGFCITHAAVDGLSSLVIKELLENEVPAIAIPPAAVIVQKGGRISRFYKKPVFDYLNAGYLPVLYGDMVLDEKAGGSVCSGDQIAAHLGKDADRIIFASNVDGVLVEGKLVKKITRENFEKIKEHLKQSQSPDVTGGMAGKIAELMHLKVPCFIVNASKPERVQALLLGKKAVCTEIRL
jgi:isopentenyl phosphate kinase